VEFAEAAQYHADLNPELGGRFYDEIERLIAEVGEDLISIGCTIRRCGATVQASFPMGYPMSGGEKGFGSSP